MMIWFFVSAIIQFLIAVMIVRSLLIALGVLVYVTDFLVRNIFLIIGIFLLFGIAVFAVVMYGYILVENWIGVILAIITLSVVYLSVKILSIIIEKLKNRKLATLLSIFSWIVFPFYFIGVWVYLFFIIDRIANPIA